MSVRRPSATSRTARQCDPRRTPRPRGRAGARLLAGVLAGSVAGSLVLAATASSATAAQDDEVDTTGTVVRVKDGDTIVVKIKGDAEKRVIRITGLNTMELTDYTPGERKGKCHAKQATRMLSEFLLTDEKDENGRRKGKTVHITAVHESSRTGQDNEDKPDRLHRSLTVEHQGQTMDPAAELIKHGLALWMPDKDEYRPNFLYAKLAKEAAENHRGLWDTDACGVGPSQNASLHIEAKWQGGDETVRVTNTGSSSVDLGKWRIRESAYHGRKAQGFRVPPGTVVPAGAAMVLHTGEDRNGERPNPPRHFYWGLEKPVLNDVPDNPAEEYTMMADGAYLFDPQGDIRAAQQYAPHAFIQFPNS